MSNLTLLAIFRFNAIFAACVNFYGLKTGIYDANTDHFLVLTLTGGVAARELIPIWQ